MLCWPSKIEVAPRVDADLPVLFGLAMATFGGLPGWSDERVLEVLNSDVISSRARTISLPATSPCTPTKQG